MREWLVCACSQRTKTISVFCLSVMQCVPSYTFKCVIKSAMDLWGWRGKEKNMLLDSLGNLPREGLALQGCPGIMGQFEPTNFIGIIQLYNNYTIIQ